MTRLRAFLLCALTGALGFWMGHYRPDATAALADTNTAQQMKIGDATQAAGHTADYATLAAQVSRTMGAKFKPASPTFTVSVEATGTVPASQFPIIPIPLSDPGFAVTMPQQRGNLPALTELHLAYDPGKADLNDALTGFWVNKPETFHVSFAEWRTSKDGMRAAVRLQREVGGQTEEIPLNKADAYFSSDAVSKIAPFPKWTLGIGSSVDSRGIHPAFLIQKHLTRDSSLTTGYVNGGPVLIYSHIFGRQ